MDIVLGVSMTPTTVRMVLVEGEGADGVTVDHDVFDVTAIEDAANSSASEQVISAILGTQQSALAGGHRLVATGVTWSDHDEAAALRDGLAARGLDDVTLVSDLHAAGALAQAAGRAVGYDKTALLFVESDTATLSVVETRDGSIIKVLSRSLHSADAMAVMGEMVTSLVGHHDRPQGVFVVGSGVDVLSVKEHLEHLVSVPVSAPDDAAMALARGAALAAAAAPRFEASTVGLAYSQDPDASSLAATELAFVGDPAPLDDDVEAELVDDNRRPFLLVGSTVTSIFVVGVVALVISLAVSIRPTADQRPNPGENMMEPGTAAPAAAPPAAQQVQPPAAQPSQPAKPAQSAPETIPEPIPVVQQAPATQQPRQVYVEPSQASAPAAAATPAVPAAPAPEPEATPAAPIPATTPPVSAPPVYQPPTYQPPAYQQPGIYVPPLIQIPLVPSPRQWFPRPQDPPWINDDSPSRSRWPQDSQTSPPQQQSPLVPQQQQPRQPGIQSPQVPQVPQPSGPSTGGSRNNPFWPF